MTNSTVDKHERQLAPVGDGEHAVLLVAKNILQRDICAVAVLVMDHSVAMAEGTPLHVLTTEADVVALHKQSGEGQGLCSGPIHAL